jgi:hypothetical protein
MVARTPAPTGDPNKIMGVPKPVFWIIVVVGAILAFYIVKKTGTGSSSPGQYQEEFPAVNPDYLQDQGSGGSGYGGALSSAGLPNIPGTNANPNPEPISDPNSQIDTSVVTSTPTTTINPYNPIYIPGPVPTYTTPPTVGAGGAYTTGPGTPTSGGAITGRGIQGGY